jgi:hypothetical protein
MISFHIFWCIVLYKAYEFELEFILFVCLKLQESQLRTHKPRPNRPRAKRQRKTENRNNLLQLNLQPRTIFWQIFR